MFYVAFTPKTNPAQAMSAQAPKLMTAFSKLLADLDLAFDAMDEWFVARILEASKEATDNMENGDEASGSWSDMGSEDDAFYIDIFNADDVRIVNLDGNDLIAPHGAVALAIGEHNHQEWIYDEDEVSQWDNVLRPQKPSTDWLDGYVELPIETNANPGCDKCGTFDRVLGTNLCAHCVNDERCEHTGMTRDELESLCGAPIADKEIVCKRRHLVDSDDERYANVGDKGKAIWDASTDQWSVGWKSNGASGFYTEEELANDALVPDTTSEPRIAAIIREVRSGDCILSALRTDGSTTKLFSFYIDELSFSDSELIGLTENEAHHLYRYRDTQYLRS